MLKIHIDHPDLFIIPTVFINIKLMNNISNILSNFKEINMFIKCFQIFTLKRNFKFIVSLHHPFYISFF